MELFYCTRCGTVYLFNVYALKVDTLSCRACGQEKAFLNVQIDQKIASIARLVFNNAAKEKTVEIKVLEMS